MIEDVDQRRRAVAAVVAEQPGLSQRGIAALVGCSQRTVSRDLIALREDPDAAKAAAPQPVPEVASNPQTSAGLDPSPDAAEPADTPHVSRPPSDAGRRYRESMDAELVRVGVVLGAPLQWNTAEHEVLSTVASDMDRRADLAAALAACEDLGSPRALKLATEIRLLGVGIARLTRALQSDIAKLLRQNQTEDVPEPSGQESVVSMKARRASNSRWAKHRLQRAAAEVQVRGEAGQGA